MVCAERAPLPERQSIYREARRCRGCLGPIYDLGVNLGDQYIVEFPNKPGQGKKAPLRLMMCDDCNLVQLSHSVRRDLLYANYYYRSGVSRTMRAALAEVVAKARARVDVRSGDAVLDIGANDGTLLGFYPPYVRRVAVEPSSIGRDIPMERADYVIEDYFSYDKIPGKFGPFNIITSIAMFYDVERPQDFALDVKDLLAPDGVWINQLNYAPLAIDNNAFDFISHEHLTYFTTRAMTQIVNQAGLKIAHVEFLPINGGTARYYIVHREFGEKTMSAQFLDSEHSKGYRFPAIWEQWGERIRVWKTEFLSVLDCLKGKTIFVFGASTRGSVILQYAGVGVSQLPYASDVDPNKHGRYMVGVDIPIISPEEARARKPDYFLVLPYSYIDEFMVTEKEFRDRGGRFIVPVPEPRIV